MKIFNTAVYGLEESIIRSGYPMLTEIDEDLDSQCDCVGNNHIKRAIKLANAWAGHSNFLKGIIVQMDVEAPQYVWMQIERYQFFTIISSQSKMHRLTRMNLGGGFLDGCYSSGAKENAELFISLYKKGNCDMEDMLDNVPMGLELTAGISTSYMCLKNMYHQRKQHRLKFWTEIFCPWVESLPMAKELICGNA